MDSDALFSWIEINQTGTRLNDISNGDDESEPISFSSWSFPFYEKDYSTIYVSSNGWMTFSDLSDAEKLCDPIPSLEQQNIDCVSLLSVDLDPSLNGDVFYNFSGTIPNRYLIIEFYNVSHKNSNLVGSFEVIFYENGTIIFQYKELRYLDNYIIGLDHGDGVN
ncbi:MAG: hypothetical protein ACFFHV_08175, partial [Promethearchaeota archaeon]